MYRMARAPGGKECGKVHSFLALPSRSKLNTYDYTNVIELKWHLKVSRIVVPEFLDHLPLPNH